MHRRMSINEKNLVVLGGGGGGGGGGNQQQKWMLLTEEDWPMKVKSSSGQGVNKERKTVAAAASTIYLITLVNLITEREQ